MFLSDNACRASAVLGATCRVYAATGGCAVCNDGYYRSDWACVACREECATCSDGASCVTCNDEHFMTVTGECKGKNETAGCSGEIDSVDGCVACDAGHYLRDKECHSCGDAFDVCFVRRDAVSVVSRRVCPEGRRVRCRLGHRALHGGVRLPCTACTFRHRPTPDGAGAMHALSGWSSSSPSSSTSFSSLVLSSLSLSPSTW